MWVVKINGKIVKEYPMYEQCVIWCYNKKLVYAEFADFISDKDFSYAPGVSVERKV